MWVNEKLFFFEATKAKFVVEIKLYRTKSFDTNHHSISLFFFFFLQSPLFRDGSGGSSSRLSRHTSQSSMISILSPGWSPKRLHFRSQNQNILVEAAKLNFHEFSSSRYFFSFFFRQKKSNISCCLLSKLKQQCSINQLAHSCDGYLYCCIHHLIKVFWFWILSAALSINFSCL